MAELPQGTPRGKRAGRAPWALRVMVTMLAIGLFGCDHATKIAAHAALAGGRTVPIYDGIVELKYMPNDDTAFSLLHLFGVPRSPELLVAASVAALAAVLVAWFVVRRRASLAQHAAFALVAAGALGNVVDRLTRGFVVDFIHVARWPVFNVADVAIVVGAAIFALGARRRETHPPAT